MTKYQNTFRGDFRTALEFLHRGIMRSSTTISFEDGSDFDLGSAQVGVRVYERYSVVGGNRVSLNVTLVSQGDMLGLSMIASGGSAGIVKQQEFSDHRFLAAGVKVVNAYLSDTGQQDAAASAIQD